MLLIAVAPAGAHMFVPEPPPEPAGVEILQPEEHELLSNRQGAVMVDVAVRELDEDEELVLLLDGEEVARETAPPNFIVLDAVARGEHRLEVMIVGEDDEVVESTPPRTFYVRGSSAEP